MLSDMSCRQQNGQRLLPLASQDLAEVLKLAPKYTGLFILYSFFQNQYVRLILFTLLFLL